MQYAICIVPVSALRNEPDHPNEIISQLLFGETCEVLDSSYAKWIRIKCKHDGYEGWCTANQFAEITWQQYEEQNDVLAEEWQQEISFNGEVMHIPFGSSTGVFKDAPGTLPGHHIITGDEGWKISSAKVSEESIRYIAFKFLNTAYLWGGRTVWGIDCSGYVQMVYKFFGIQLMRDAYMQSAQGDAVGFLEEVHCGDLAFFEDDERKIIHVGLLLNSNQVIHASGKVRVDIIDNQGIVNSDTGERTHQLRIIKRLKNISSL